MLNLIYHTPQGVCDILPEECYAKNQIEQRIMKMFNGLGYQDIQPPMFEYYDLYASQKGDISAEKLFKFFDAQGRILALRPDITTSIARIMATKMEDVSKPTRLCYLGSSFRYNGSGSGLNSEFTQAGIELIGQSGTAADAEVIVLAIRALLAAGLKEFQIDIGQTDFFKGLAESSGLTDEQTDKLRGLIDYKDTPSIAALLDNIGIDAQTKELLTMLPSLFGDHEVLEKIRSYNLNERSAKALENIAQVYDIINGCGYSEYVSIDLGMLQSIDYYTGMIFKGFTYDVGFAICGGGRYDTLIEQFSTTMPAVGVSLSINRILSALQRQNISLDVLVTDVLVYAPENLAAAAIQTACTLSDQGLTAACCTNAQSREEAAELAEKKGIKTVIYIVDTGAVIEQEGQSSRKITLDELSKGGWIL